MDKPFKTYEELMELMRSRGLAVDGKTLFVLKREGYYAVVNGYKDPFLEHKSPEVFKAGAEFSEIYSLFVMDRHLRSILFRYTTLAEAALKTACTYEFCKAHRGDNEAYLDPNAYRSDGEYASRAKNLIESINRVVLGRAPKSPRKIKPYVQHYIDKHDNVPLWVVMNHLGLTDAFKFFDYQPESIRFAIARSFQEAYEETHRDRRRITHVDLRKAYDHIKDFRNICAHDERLYCARVDKSKSTWFRDVIGDLEIALASYQHDELVRSVAKQVMIASQRISTIDQKDMLSAMGYRSLDELSSRNGW